MRILGICGSLRKASYNRRLLVAAQGLVPAGVTIEIAELRDIPIFDQDVQEAGDPPAVAALKGRVRDSEGLLLATPEYNWGVPGPLKNTIDWLSRPPRESPLVRKPVALMGATTGPWGTVRAQLALRQILLFPQMQVLPSPWVHVTMAKDKFASDGALTDEQTKQQIRDLLAAFERWIAQVTPPV